MKIPAPVVIDPDFWMGRRVLVTGHTGFKGAWTTLWLQSLGAEVIGLARGASGGPSLYGLADVGAGMRELALDVRDADAVRDAVAQANPEVVLHLAAQPLVRRSLRDPVLTYEVNLMGTVNVLDAIREVGSEVRAIVVVTSDKSYENPGEVSRRFVEDDPLGGEDPYSSSKACAELVASAYRRSFFSTDGAPRLATARAGNVIGGGDWGEDRLIADAVRAGERDETLLVRNPHAVRPWQHVLNPLAGYLLLAQALWNGPGAAQAWNFGPSAGDARTVSWIVERLGELWDGALDWKLDEGDNPPEAHHLALDSSKAERELRWSPRWDLDDALALVVEWHRAHRAGEAMRAVSLAQIARFDSPTPR
ncbi:MAG TPA: CDP-glucose 4,6-dehydratase [Solirubrobacteraceae bacterium]|nr:CDP-glucose 4,6-dehydratase [Solirubrobacteraceae bacterium]